VRIAILTKFGSCQSPQFPLCAERYYPHPAKDIFCFSDLSVFSLAEGSEPMENALQQRDRASALLLAYKHLHPQLLSSPGQRAAILTEAAQTYEKLGDKKAVDGCHMMMKKMERTIPAPITIGAY
jgi:hypothetical protein